VIAACEEILVIAGIVPNFIGAGFTGKRTDDGPTFYINDHRIRPSIGTTKQSLGERPERHSGVTVAAECPKKVKLSALLAAAAVAPWLLAVTGLPSTAQKSASKDEVFGVTSVRVRPST
jgi:hypothetical protein